MRIVQLLIGLAMKSNCGTVSNNIHPVVVIAVLDSAETINPRSPPISAIRKRVMAGESSTWSPPGVLNSVKKLMTVQTNA